MVLWLAEETMTCQLQMTVIIAADRTNEWENKELMNARNSSWILHHAVVSMDFQLDPVIIEQ